MTLDFKLDLAKNGTIALNSQPFLTQDLVTNDLLHHSLKQADELLSDFLNRPDWVQQMELPFGEAEEWGENLSAPLNLPRLSIVSATELQGALGAYAGETNQIFLSQELILANADHPEAVTAVLLEEIGHAIDAQINETDSPGDEGAIFASLMQGEDLNPETLAQLQAEDDSATLTIDGETVIVEQATVSIAPDESALRTAISSANAGDTITFNASGTITLTNGQLDIDKALTIDGDLDDDGTPDITIDAGGNSRVFNIDDRDFESAIDVTIDGLTISGGSASNGGGIRNNENLTLNNSTISSNSADSAGGIYNRGTASIINSTISSNSSNFGAGGIYNYGTASIINSTISGNISNNSSTFGAGGIYNQGTASIINSTISGNSAVTGGVKNGFNDTISISNSTISGNSGSKGGGIYNDGTANISNSIIVNSVGGDVRGRSLIIAEGVNLVEDGSISSALTLDPNLSPLQDNGGLTLTQIPLAGSPVIDLGDNRLIPTDEFDLDSDGDTTEAVPFDQTSNSRIANSSIDIGAVEFQGSGTAILTVPSLSANLIVDTSVDENDFDLSPGDISLREALAFTEEGGTISFAPNLAGQTITLNSNLIIDKSLTLEGLGEDQLTLDGGGFDRVLTVDDGDNSVSKTVAISGLTISGGTAQNGGGILNRENLTLTNSTLSGNSARTGGGIDNEGTASLINSIVTDNSASSRGGGIFSSENLTISNTIISGNSADSEGGGIFNSQSLTLGISTIINSSVSSNSANRGGGIVNGGTLDLNNSTVSNNSADEEGGGIYLSYGTASLTNSIISGNSGNRGGGIYNNRTFMLTNSTVSGNSANEEGGGIFGSLGSSSPSNSTIINSTINDNTATQGGGLYNSYSYNYFTNNLDIGTVTLTNSIIANSIGGDVTDQQDGVTTEGVNIIQDGSIPTSDSVLNADPLLEPLADNGGITLTHALLEDSPAIDAGDNNQIPPDTFDLDSDGDTSEPIPFDQRGDGFDRVFNGQVDIGAFELGDNEVPIANNDTASTDEETTLNVNAANGVLANDTDPDEGDTLSISAVNGDAANVGTEFELASGALLTVNVDGSYIFNPNSAFENLNDGETGEDIFTYTVSDGNGGTDTAEVTITINGITDNVNDDNVPPNFVDTQVTVDENTTAVALEVEDPDGDNVTLSLAGGADQGLFTVDVDGNLSFIEAPDFENPIDADEDNIYELEVTVADGNGGNTSQTLNIEVLDVSEETNEPPIITSDSLQTIEENAIAPLSLQADDPDGDEVTFSLTGGADQGLFTINPDTGELEFNNPPDFENPIDADEDNIYELEVTAADGNGGIITENFQIEVTDVDETIDWSLDIDGNGEISPLSDGIMTVRFLFGDAFSNDDLINGAIGAEASRSLPEIRDHLQIGVDEGFLDIDEDGEINPLSDGIIAVRFLFGDAFAGEALINGAISPDSSLSLEEIQANLADLTSI
ncbi:beta strand repeat-containing protein [Dactylococcopsis salina]|uniref:Cadherin domain-containing protein n=1 Tax=Dactylococcopsis salina (strain PCC 8305) TaxID=13035 RepID=K9YRL4_DACS8|nr:choice-of-anchor Q domain-containing protein [Dactylococcopsis salina]AFZ49127.1 hypothetical protein Dacsa_0324 [Dactylococcopsis salina PCC 8305]